MGVTTTKTNKPLNPRGNDGSPLKYNRAKLFSGKALDFDGVNDYIVDQTIDVSSTSFAVSFYVKSDTFQNNGCAFSIGSAIDFDLVFYPYDDQVNGVRIYDKQKNNTLLQFTGPKLGVYNMFTFQCDGEYLEVYVNGIFSAKAARVYSSTYARVQIGKLLTSVQYYNGQIANFKLFNTALTAAQVADLYNNPEKVVPTGVDNTALKLWLPMQEGAGTYCINGADPLGADEYNGAGSFDSATGWTLNTGFSIGGGSLSCDGSQTAATSAYYNISSVASSLVMVQFTLSNVTAGQIQLAFFGASGTATKWYTADGTYTEYVEVAAGHNGNTGFIANADFVGDIDNLTLKVVNTGAISGATWTHGIGAPVAQTAVIDWNKETTGAGTTMLLPQGLTTGRDITGVNLFENVRKQGALNLDGNSWAEVHDNESLDITSAITLETWYYHDTTTTNEGLLGRWNATTTTYLLLKNDTNVRFYTQSTSAINVNASVSTAGWHHVVGTYDGTTMRIYLDGSESATIGQTGSINTSTFPLEIGRYYSSQTYSQTGQIAQPRIYNRALTAAEVLQNYNSGKNTYTNN